MRISDANRWFFYVALASALHGSALLFRSRKPVNVAPARAALDPIELALLRDPPGATLGGEGTRSARPSAPEGRSKPSAPARLAARAPPRIARADSEAQRGGARSPEPFATDMLASDDSNPEARERPHAARQRLLANQREAAPDPARQIGGSSRFSGPATSPNGGGGPGVVGGEFAFGGPRGAFRAEVCFIEPTVRVLSDITACAPVLTFYTNLLNVSPRRFDQGFPGIGERTEWFAIKYVGKFQVTAEDSYTFRLLSDDGARLEIDGRQVVDNDGLHQPLAVSGTVQLAAGEHDFFVFYYQGPPDFVALQLFVKRAGFEEQLFSPVI